MGVASDPFDLERFVAAQASVYETVQAELGAGQKRSHWMWFIFPQIRGLGSSPMALRFAIEKVQEARAYLAHPVLGARLAECARLVLAIKEKPIDQAFPHPDHLKLKSSMTLFGEAAEKSNIFHAVLNAHFGGQRDTATLELLEAHRNTA